MPTPDLVFKSGQELAALIKTRKVSPVEVTEAFLDRAQMLNPRVNAFVTLREGVQDGDEQNAWEKSTPSRAMRSKVGVRTTRSPLAPVCATAKARVNCPVA